MEKLTRTVDDPWIADASIDFIRETSQRGLLALHVRLHGQPKKPSGTTNAYTAVIADVVTAARRAALPRRRILRLAGDIDLTSSAVLLLMASFRDNGFEVHAEFANDPGVPIPRDIIAWATLRTSVPIVLQWFNEIIYAPPTEDLDSGQIKPLTYPVRDLPNVLLWLNVASGAASFDAVRKFLVESPWPWAVAL
jgi:hypothetical protein